MRIHVDDCRELGFTHRRGAAGQELRRPGGDLARPVGLHDELSPVPATDAEELGRPEQISGDALEPRRQLPSRLHHVVPVGAGDKDAHDVPERWIAELLPARELAREESGDVVPGSKSNDPGLGLEAG